MYGVYSHDGTFIQSFEKQEDADDYVKELNEPDPFALMFEKSTYYTKQM